MGDVVNFVSYKVNREAVKSTDGQVRFRCLVCKQYWNQEKPEGMKKVNCPKCGSTMLKFKED